MSEAFESTAAIVRRVIDTTEVEHLVTKDQADRLVAELVAALPADAVAAEVRAYVGRNPDGGYQLIAASPAGDIDWARLHAESYIARHPLGNYEEAIVVAVIETIAEGPVPE